jgi:Sulfotransferase family
VPRRPGPPRGWLIGRRPGRGSLSQRSGAARLLGQPACVAFVIATGTVVRPATLLGSSDVETPRELLFLVGPGRSGTSALTEVMNGHPELAIGMERYKRLWRGRINELTPAHFTREVFFDFDDGLTNITPSRPEWVRYYEELDAKFDTARYVGDKMTSIRIRQMLHNLPEAKFICIVRHIRPLAYSWHARATNPDDVNWPQRNDARQAVAEWNNALRKILRARSAHPTRVAVLEYSSFFGDPAGAPLRAALDFLGLEFGPGIQRTFTVAHETYVQQISTKRRPLDQETRLFINEFADMGLWRRVKAQALV